MGEEAPEYLLNGVDYYCLTAGLDLETKGHHTTTFFGDKIYVIGEPNGGSNLSYNVKTFDKLTKQWSIPIVLGTKPIPSKGHSALPFNKDRILILKQDSTLDNSIWFLEVDTPFVKEQSKLLGTEVLAWSKGMRGSGPKPVVISGPSGVGKGTLISKLMDDFPSSFGFSVSHTTRAPREKEKDGVHYHFTERSKMEKDIREGKFLETASVHGNLYGTSVEAVEAVADAGKRCILDIDVQGARSVRVSSLEAVFIFICPPSFEELEKRLRSRGTETEEQVQKRLRNARAELDQGKSPGLFDHILVNDDLATCYENLKKILDLDRENTADQPSVEEVKVPECHSVSIRDQRVLIQCETNQVGAAPATSFVIDLSMLKGGAPGRTRGLDIYTVDSVTDCDHGIKPL